MLFEANGILCKYNCSYGSEDHIDHMLVIEDMVFKKPTLNKIGKAIPKGKIETQIMGKSIGDSQKKGCRCTFTLKAFYLLLGVTKICCYETQHVNAMGVVCHANCMQGMKSTFIAHVFVPMKEFIMGNLQLGLSISQVMVKYR